MAYKMAGEDRVMEDHAQNCFHACYGTKVEAIVDCYEIKIETPANLVAKSATWSQYRGGV